MEPNKPRRPLPVPGARACSPGQATQRPSTPTPTSAQRPSTPTLTPALPPRPSTPTSAPAFPLKPTPVPASSFYADPRKKDSASGHSRQYSLSDSSSTSNEKSSQASTSGTSKVKSEGKLGSASTTFTNTPLSEDYRAPELIPEDEEPPPFSSVVSEYTSEHTTSDSTWSNQSKRGNQWGNQSGTTAYNTFGWGDGSMLSGWGNEGSNEVVGWGGPDASTNENNTNTSTSIVPEIPITNRFDEDELRWWDREHVWGRSFPGKGVLPVLTAESIEAGLQRLIGKRVGSKGLYKVEITSPDITPSEQKESNNEHPVPRISPPPSLTRTGSNSSLNPSSRAPSLPKSARPRHHHVPPSALEVEMAGKPHPDAYYSPKENAWVVLSWEDSSSAKASSRDPLPSFVVEARAYTLPRNEYRMENKGENCLAFMTKSDRRCYNLTHHFHKYPKSIDGRNLDPPVRHWKDDFSVGDANEGESPTDVSATDDGQVLLDLYVCCQCSFYLVVSSPSILTSSEISNSASGDMGRSSNVIPGIIPLRIWNAYVNDRLENPNPSMSREQTLLGGLETLVIIIQNRLWKGEDRNIKVNGKGFTRRLGWGDLIQSILRTLSFYPETHKNPANPQQIDTFLRGPVVTPTTSEGRLNRRRLIRAWVEISSWISEWKERDSVARALVKSYKEHDLWVKLNPTGESVREMYQKAIGAHVEQIPRPDLPTAILDHLRSKEITDKFLVLGLTPTAWTADLLCFAYLAQTRCDPPHTPSYFGALQLIMNAFVQLSSIPEFEKAFVGSMKGNGAGVGNMATIDSTLLTPTPLSYNSASAINLDIITNLYVQEDSRGRWSEETLVNAVEMLGFTYTGAFREGPLGWLNMEWDGDLIHNRAHGDAYNRGVSEYAWATNNPEDQHDRLIWENCDCYTSEELENSIPDQHIYNAWRECATRAFIRGSVDDTPGGRQGLKDHTDALRIIAESRGSNGLMVSWDHARRGTAESGDLRDTNRIGGYDSFGGIAEAYRALEVPLDIDDAMLITIYQMRVDDSPMQLEKMQRALYLISQERDSPRLKEFATTMRDPGEIPAPTRAEWPRGLNQLGNTCYLNSLLQYFYTIKELRSSIITMGSMSGESTAGKDTQSSGLKDNNAILASSHTTSQNHSDTLDLVKDPVKAKMLDGVTDDDLKRHRVGGRLVTRREIVRSKHFVSHLADLFHKLEYADHPSVTPSIELAKLALVTSKDEEEEVEEESNKADSQSNKAGTDSSQDTDATLVEDLPPRPSHPPPYQSSTGSSSQTERPPRTNSPISISSSSSTSPHSSYNLTNSPPSPTRSPSSVLGKRARDRDAPSAGLSREDTEILDDHLLRASASPPPSSVASLGSISRDGSRVSEGPPPLVSVSEFRDSEDVVMRDVSPAQNVSKLPQHPPPLPPRKPAPLAHNDSVMMFGKQHDVAECMDNCMFQIETALLKFHGSGEGNADDAALDDTEKTSIVKRLFYGKIRQTFIETLKGEPTRHEKEDLFSHLPVNVGDEVDLLDRGTSPPFYDADLSAVADDTDTSKDSKEYSTFDIYDGLGRYFDDMIEYEGQKVPMEVGLVKLPPLLQVQLQRVQFNRELLQSWKSQAYVKFGEALYMDRFMDTADPEKRKKSKEVQDELNACRERLKLLTKSKSSTVSFSDALQTTYNFLSSSGAFLSSLSIPVAQSQLPSLSSEPNYIQNEIRRLRTRIPELKVQLESLWAENKEVEYELTSVFIHRGSTPSFGHYFFYSRSLPEQPDVWYKYNDEEVSKVGKEEVFRNTTGETANPYLLVFARKGSQVIETVNRFDPALLNNNSRMSPEPGSVVKQAEALKADSSSQDMLTDWGATSQLNENIAA
ncbi:hypothetical protein GGU10DRAFT_166019 [Lentinula aff. detonsa]|uniref:ubiquitinyl hydrolase 1 n=1 Tax=Lentinula aff. detonsa TaxID=2804958 RepID=A0AA38L672_9AGAR|nr:hypothetical protein GGU10DRAFT_166019 [Lentinula aff. detonsa]